MVITQSPFRAFVDLVHVDTDELDCGARRLPYPTCIGVVDWVKGRVEVWTPAASKPRGYHAAARALLESVLAAPHLHASQGKV